MSDNDDRFSVVVVALLAILLVFQLLVPPIVGLADTGDFDRLWRWFGIDSAIVDPDQRYFRHLIREWRIDPSKAESSGFVSTDLLFVAASVQLNALLSDPGVYDLRALSAIRIVLFLGIAFVLMRVAARGGRRMRMIAACALLFVFADVGYIAYFNSGFTEAASLLFGLLTIAIFLRLALAEGNRSLNLALFVVSGILLIWSKAQNVLLALPLAFIAFRFASLDRSARWRSATILGATLLVASAVLYRTLPPPPWYTHQIRHIAVFNSLLLGSPDAAADLRALGVDPRWVVLVGQFPWSPLATKHANELQSEFHDRVDEATIIGFYLDNPGRLLQRLKDSASQSLAVRVGVGQFEAASGRPPFTRATAFALRSDSIRDVGPHRFRWILFLLALAVAVAVSSWNTARNQAERLCAEGTFMLALAAAIQYVTVAVLQGPVAVSKGMLLFAFFYDATIIAALAIVVHRAPDWRSRWRMRARTAV